jgi:D-aminopeptidase
MKTLIMCDMEGVSGIVVWDQVTGGAPMYEEGRKLYTEEINAGSTGICICIHPSLRDGNNGRYTCSRR